MTIATPAHLEDELPLRQEEARHEISVAARALGARALPIEERPRWQVGEDDIVVVSNWVILGALVAIIVVAAAAILTMG
ncbi:hypothetical protein [Mycobacterium sp. Marseille-P9652]|uniref:hypothetical protein n=1 Tax=Mycobacterium sp. Marseille-P9652 TaxID=2654950 RepID=UPI0012E80066|nr:hypothetical protein [Mycobacterium sp. Marseille-P9652]